MKRKPGSQPELTLFPFLAVLVCTLGALILLLGVIARQARLNAAATVVEAPPAAAQPPSLSPSPDDDARLQQQLAADDLQWQIEQLRAIRERTLERLADQRLELSHLEDHARQLRDQLVALEAQLANDAAARSQRSADLELLRSQLAETQRRVDELRRELAAAEAQRLAAGPKFAIVPYDGPNPTRRHPVYIECRASTITLQPEGVLLTERDFPGVVGPNNPLAAALRAAREHLAGASSALGETPQEPYPLLIVRPDGVMAYYVARAALASWDADFGYELVDRDLDLAYPPADQGLRQAMATAVDDARRRQLALAALAPRFARAGSGAVYRAAPGGGGIVRIDAPEDNDWDSPGESWSAPPRPATSGDTTGRSASRPGPGGPDPAYNPYEGLAERYGASPSEPSPPGGGDRGPGGRLPANELASGGGGPAPGTALLGGAVPGAAVSTSQGTADGSFFPLGPTGPGTASSRYGLDDGPLPDETAARRESVAPRGATAAAQTPAGPSPSPFYPGTGAAGEVAPASNAAGNSPSGHTSPPGTAWAQDTAFPSSTGTPPAPSNIDSPSNAPQSLGVAGPTPSSGPRLGEYVEGASRAPGTFDGYGPASASSMADRAAFGPGAAGATTSASPSGTPGAAGSSGSPPSGDGQPSSASASVSLPTSGAGRSASSLARMRGRDWALPESSRGAIGVTRPIQVDFYSDHLTVYGAGLDRRPVRVIPLEGDTSDAVDDFVSSVWEQIELWGMAGRGMYWRPVINATVVSGGERRYAEFVQLLEGSGLQLAPPRQR